MADCDNMADSKVGGKGVPGPKSAGVGLGGEGGPV